MKIHFRMFVGLGLVLSAGVCADIITHGGTTTVNMDFVAIGNPGNDADTTGNPDPCGRVDYTYRIGTYEVSETQWDAVSGASSTDLLDDAGRWSGAQPVAAISWHEVAMFCNWLTSGDVAQGAYTIDNTSGVVTGTDRAFAAGTYDTIYVIPTEDEWYKAAYYDPTESVYYNYPTGSDSVPDGINSSGDTVFDAVFNDGYYQGAPNNIDNAGVLSPYGTMGQGGNVYEWNETAIGGNRGTRGGSAGSTGYYLRADYRHYNDPANEYDLIGFRVASISVVPEPGSLGLLLLGLAGMVARRRRVAV